MLRKGMVISVLALTLSGCVLMPKPPALSEASVLQTQSSIIDGQTSLAELKTKFGEQKAITPTEKGKLNYLWRSTWANTPTSGPTTTGLVALVDNGVVQKHVAFHPGGTADWLITASQEKINQFLIPGTTVEATVEAKYGKPHSYVFDDDGNKVMMYVWDGLTKDAISFVPIVGEFAGTASGKINTLFVTLNPNGTVKKGVLESVNSSRGTGAFNASAVKVSP
ncbi:hypothetical protein ACSFCW_00515 [Yokenella regensburgei]|uniref:hypothetical protein n=1 Tax=Yokenella regensburgei TaxID=158877 RepID=UPI003ED94620